MERLKALFRQTESHILLFLISLVLFSWPVVSYSDVERLKVMFVYLFVAWAVVVGLLFLVSRSLSEHDEHEGDKVGEK